VLASPLALGLWRYTYGYLPRRSQEQIVDSGESNARPTRLSSTVWPLLYVNLQSFCI